MTKEVGLGEGRGVQRSWVEGVGKGDQRSWVHQGFRGMFQVAEFRK